MGGSGLGTFFNSLSDFRFLGCRPSFALFQDVLLSRPSGLNHLVDRAIAFGEIIVGKAKGDGVDDSRFLEGQQRMIVAARR